MEHCMNSRDSSLLCNRRMVLLLFRDQNMISSNKFQLISKLCNIYTYHKLRYVLHKLRSNPVTIKFLSHSSRHFFCILSLSKNPL